METALYDFRWARGARVA